MLASHVCSQSTEEHPIYVIGQGYVPARNVEIGREVICADPMLSVPEMSYEAARRCKQEIIVGTKTVVSVEHGVRLPDKVYNLRVSNTHNYFANGILLHNSNHPLL